MQSLNDGTPDVRDAAFSALAAIAKVVISRCSIFISLVFLCANLVILTFLLFKMVGMRPLEKSLEKLDDVRQKKLSEMIGGSTGDPSTLPNSGLESDFCNILGS